MFTALLALFALVPSALLAAVALLTWRVTGPRAPAFQVGLWVGAAAGLGAAVWQVAELHAASRRPGFTTSGMVLAFIPLMAAGAAAAGLAVGWAGATAVVEARRLSAGTTTAGGTLARSVLPAALLLAAAVFAYAQTRPSAGNRVDAADSPGAFARLYDEAAASNDLDLLQSLANSRSIPPSLLARLAAHPHPWVRARAARNETTPADALRLLADDPDPDVRLGVAENRGAADDLLRTLAARPNDPAAAAADRLLRGRASVPATAPTTRSSVPTERQPQG